MHTKLLLAHAAMILVTASSPRQFGAAAQAAEFESANYRPLPSRVGDFAFKVEPAVAIPLTKPQSHLFNTGGSETLKALWVMNEYMDVGPSATFLTLPSQTAGGEAGTGWTFGGSLRMKEPRDALDRFLAISPWVDADVLYIRTGGLDRLGFAAAAGVAVPIGKARVFWVGPFARYLQIFEPTRGGYDNRDAKILNVGLTLEVGLGRERERTIVTATEATTIETLTQACPDGDHDGLPDSVDRCPEVAGPVDNWGCPPYKKLVVQRDKLELKEKLYFAWNQAVLQEVSFPVLDEVVQALNDNKRIRVRVEGHASSEGTDDHNQMLSEERADAVLGYLVTHGVDRSQLFAKGFGSSVPIDTNVTIAGRENNRRVEFVVVFKILSEGAN